MNKKKSSEFLTDRNCRFWGKIRKKGRSEIFRPNVQWWIFLKTCSGKEEARMKSNGMWRVNGKTPKFERRKGKRRWTPIQTVAQDTWASLNNLETHIVRKWGDIGHQRAVDPRIIQCSTYLPCLPLPPLPSQIPTPSTIAVWLIVCLNAWMPDSHLEISKLYTFLLLAIIIKWLQYWFNSRDTYIPEGLNS